MPAPAQLSLALRNFSADDPGSWAPLLALRRPVVLAKRSHERLQVTGTLPADLGDVPAMIAAGVTDFRHHQPLPADPTHAEELLTDLVQRFRAVAHG